MYATYRDLRAQEYKLTLKYFDARGRCEHIRLLFAAGQREYEDIRLTGHTEWSELKPKTPFGTLPVLEADGHVISGSPAIARMVAKICDLAGSNYLQQALVDSVVDVCIDLRELLIASVSNSQSSESKAEENGEQNTEQNNASNVEQDSKESTEQNSEDKNQPRVEPDIQQSTEQNTEQNAEQNGEQSGEQQTEQNTEQTTPQSAEQNGEQTSDHQSEQEQNSQEQDNQTKPSDGNDKEKTILQNLEKFLGQNNFFVENKLSYADIQFYASAEIAILTQGRSDILNDNPALQALYDRVAEVPAIAQYLVARHDTQF